MLDDPMLDGVAAVLFDEFHERSLDADLGLALARDVQQGLREDLRLLVMSATIDGARVAALLGDAPVIDSVGPRLPGGNSLCRPRCAARSSRRSPTPSCARCAIDRGSLLAFLPGAAEIRRTKALLEGRLDPAIDVAALYGALAGDEQDRAIAPSPPGRRKIVLATSIAETSITIEGVRIVDRQRACPRAALRARRRADAARNRARLARRAPTSAAAAPDAPSPASATGSGTSRRRPRSNPSPGRKSSPPIYRPSRSTSRPGGPAPENLAFLDAPPRPALAEAKTLLAALGAIDGDGRITEESRRLRPLPLAPAAHAAVVVAAAASAPAAPAAAEGAALQAAEIAALIGERGLGGDDVDLRDRLAKLRSDRSSRARETRARWRERWADIAKSQDAPLAQTAPSPQGGGKQQAGGEQISPGALLALAYPERIAKNRGGEIKRVFAGERPRCQSTRPPPSRAKISLRSPSLPAQRPGPHPLAAPITLAEIEARSPIASRRARRSRSMPASASLRGRKSRRLGALCFRTSRRRSSPIDDTAQKLAAGIASLGMHRLPWTKSLQQWRDRVMFLRTSEGEDMA